MQHQLSTAVRRPGTAPEPTITQRGLPPGLFCRSSSSRLTSRKCDRWLTPALSSNPSAVNRGSCRSRFAGIGSCVRVDDGLLVRLSLVWPCCQI
jgi:hypothetical protein